MEINRITELTDFIEQSPTAFHAVQNLKTMLDKDGFQELKEAEKWHLEPDGKYYVTRNNSSIIALKLGNALDEYSFHVTASHRDSPTFNSKENIEIKTYRIIYDAIEDVKSAMIGMLEPEYKEVINGKAEVRMTYKISNVGTIAGCYVIDGKIVRNSEVRVIRDGIVIFESTLASLKRFKDDAKEVAKGYECGLSVEKFNDLKEGDIIESFTMEAIKRKELKEVF